MTDPGVETVQSLVEKLNLSEVTFYHVEGSLRGADDVQSADDDRELADDDIVTDFAFRTRHVGNEFGARIIVEVETTQGHACVDVACEYVSDKPLRIPREVAYEFVNSVALMQAFPFVREAVMTLTARIFRSPVLLPVFMRGQIQFRPEGGPDVSDGAENARELAATEADENPGIN